MHCIKNIKEDVYYVGGSDRRLSLFENVFPIPRGVSYNSYIIDDDKTVLMDTVDKSISNVFFENIKHILNGKNLDYLIVNHMEPDHCATMEELIIRYPNVKIIGNAKTLVMIKQFFDFDVDSHFITVKEGDTLNTGKHTFIFVMATMVHWPEAMVTYDSNNKILYSADAFGTFGAISGNIFADEVDFTNKWIDDARRYYTNIVGKYGTQVQALLKKASKLDIEMICPLHGPVWRKNLGWIIDKYQKWSTYTPEENAVMIAYASVYGDTENAVSILANKLGDLGVCNIVMYDVSQTNPSIIVAESFRCSHLVFASTTYNAGIFCNMETVLLDIKAHNLQNRTVAIIENGSWAPTSGGLMKEIFSNMKSMTVLENMITIKSSLKEQQLVDIDSLATAIVSTMNLSLSPINHESKIEPNAMFKLSYGLYVLTAKDDEKDNGCIINTVMQVTDSPKRISIAVNKANFTHDMILKTGVFNISALSQDAAFKIFEKFGFQSGKNVDKFKDDEKKSRTDNGILYIPTSTNAVISAKVVLMEEFETHTVFIAEVTQAIVLSNIPSVTYEYYFANIKPKPKAIETSKKGFVCKICGFVYEGDSLPSDFICPLCKHGAEEFELLN